MAEIFIQDVDFSYGERQIFKGFTLRIKSGERVALVGETGSGKSTLIKLIMRYHDISRGSITIGGQDIADVKRESLWRNISLVSQDDTLFYRTMAENIGYGQPRASLKDIERVAKAAYAHEFIMRLEEGYQTYVGERGVKLSGGERQRTSIARALLKNAPIVILDEPTSALDYETELHVQQSFDRLLEGRTSITVAHRLSTIRRSDRIVVMEHGRIAEVGTHEELLEKQGLYHRLHSIQDSSSGNSSIFLR